VSAVGDVRGAGSPGDELRAYYGCVELARRGLDAVPAYDEHGRCTGQVAIDPDAFADWLDDLYEGDD
jgi:hypothetical protein